MSQDYLIKGESLTAIADEVRELSGTTELMSPDAMATNIEDANSEVNSQTGLLAQLATALEGKAAGGAAPVLQEKTITPSTSLQNVIPDSGYDGLSSVKVNAMPTATQATPSVSVSSSGLITASATQTAGYVSAGTKSATKQLTTQTAKTITPTKSAQTAVASGVYTTGAVTVSAIPDTYIQPSGTLAVTENGTHDVKNYASVSVSVAGSGSGGGTGGGTCTVSIITPSGVCVFGYGSCDMYLSLDNGATFSVLVATNSPLANAPLGETSVPASVSNYSPVPAKRVFNNIPVGSVFTFYFANGYITGATITGNIDFSRANPTGATTSNVPFAVCRCNGDGEITINI